MLIKLYFGPPSTKPIHEQANYEDEFRFSYINYET